MTPDARLARIAARQEGNVTTRQCLQAGLSPEQVKTRRRRGLLIPRHRGVWAWGHAPDSWFSSAFAAWLAYGPTAALSHATAAACLLVLPEPAGPLHVTRATGGCEHRGTRLHESVLARDTWHRRGLVLTSPARLMLDLAASGDPRVVERAYNQAQVLKLLTPEHLRARLAGWAGRRGVRLLRELVEGIGVSRSELEDRFSALVRAAGLPAPERNQWIEGVYVDAVWREERVVVELDSRRFHGHDDAFEGDRSKNNALVLRGWTVLRFTHRRLTQEPLAVIAELVAALSRSAAT